MSTEENKAIIRRLIEEVYNEEKLDVVDELVAPDILDHAAVSEHQHGTDSFKHVIRWVRASGPDTHYAIEDMIAEEDRVAVRMTVSGTHTGKLGDIPPTGRRFSVDYVHWFRLAGGKLVEMWAVRDDLSRMQQLGLFSMPGRSEGSGSGPDPEDILSYWFPDEEIYDGDLETFRRQMEWWFGGGPEVDREISERFGHVLEQARNGELDHWADTVRGRLALIIVLDQFSRNAYRGTPQAYTQDPKALGLAVEGIEAGMERELTPSERIFLWLPLTHSEDLAMHERVVRHSEEGAADAPPGWRPAYEFGLSQARANREVIARFGRHPHRNEVIGRPSTPEELEWLRTEILVYLRRPPSLG